MRYSEQPPSPALRRYVACYWSLAGEGAGVDAIFPDGRMEMVFHFGDRFRAGEAEQPRALLVGQMTGPVVVARRRRVDVFGVRFRPATAACFVPSCVRDANGRIVPLADAWREAAEELRERLAEAGDRAAAADAWLRSRIRREPDALVEALAGALARGERVDSGFSSRHARRRFVEAVGLGPKRFERIARFQRALRLIDTVALAEVAAIVGYADQAHLTREFREFGGFTPRGLQPPSAIRGAV